MKKNIITIIKFTLFLSIGIFFIWIFLKNLTPKQKHEIMLSFREVNYFWILVSLMIGFVSHVFRALRWKMLLRPLGYNPKLTNVIYSVFIGYFANLALPRLGEVSRCGILVKTDKINFNQSFGTVIVERALDFLVFILIFTINLFVQFDLIYKYYYDKIYSRFLIKYSNFNIGKTSVIIFFIIIVFIILISLVFRKKIFEIKIFNKLLKLVMGFWEGIKSLAKIEKPLLFIVYTLLIWSCYIAANIVCFYCLIETSALGISAGVSITVFAAIGIMVVQGGIGITPAIISEVLYVYSIPIVKSYAFGWLVWTSQNLVIIIAGILSLILISMQKNKIKI